MSEQAPHIGKPGLPRKQPHSVCMAQAVCLRLVTLGAGGACRRAAAYVIEKKGGPAAFISARVSEALPGATTHISDVLFTMI